VVVADLSDNEEQIGEAIEIDRRLRIDQLRFGEPLDGDLDTAADSASDMEMCGSRSSAWKNETR